MFPLRKYTLTKTEIQKIRPAPATAPLPARPSSQVEKERSGGGGYFAGQDGDTVRVGQVVRILSF